MYAARVPACNSRIEGDPMAKTYDLVIIGSGTAAQVASARVRAAGWEIAVIDHLPLLLAGVG